MKQVEVTYYLSKIGQKAAVLLGLSGASEQTVLIDGTEELINSPFVSIASSGKISLDFAHLSRPYWGYATEDVAYGVGRRTKLTVRTTSTYEHLPISFRDPLLTTDQVIAALNDLTQQINALESGRAEVEAVWKREDDEKIETFLASKMAHVKNQIGMRVQETSKYFPPEFNAEIEAGNAKMFEREDEAKVRYAEAKAKAEAEDVKAKAKFDAEEKKFEEDKAAWIGINGSDYLKLAYKEKYDCLSLYARERAALEYKGFEVVKTGQFKKCCCPTQSALEESVALTAAYSVPVRVVWHNNAEALLIRNFLGGRYDLMKIPELVNVPAP